MNRIYNVWIFILSLATLPFAFAVGLNKDFGLFGITIPGEEFQHKELVFGLSAGLILFLGARRAFKRWGGIRVLKQRKRFQFSSIISPERSKFVVMNNIIEMIFYLLIALVFVYFSREAVLVILVLVILSIDTLINTIFGVAQQKYRIGMTKKAIVSADREIKAIYFKGLKRITKHENMLFFEYINDLVLELPISSIPESRRVEFMELLRSNIDDKKVFYSGFEINEK